MLTMNWVVLFLAFCGALLYVAGAFTPSPVEAPAPAKNSPLNGPEQAQRSSRPQSNLHAIDPAGPSTETGGLSVVEEGAGDAGQGYAAESQQDLQDSAPNGTVSTQAPSSLGTEQQATPAWGRLLRGAPVHSGPSVSSSRLGYATAGAEMRLLERNLGWVRIRDPATSREGWIYEEHIAATEEPSVPGYGEDQAALADDDETGALEQQERSATAKKSKKKYSKKRWRKRLRFVFRRF